MSNFIKNFVKDERGVTAIEYALIAGLIAVALAVSIGNVTTKLTAVFAAIVTAI
ncbi:Flp family type IVb pilin [Caballeronia sp. SEWSISQ10-4 2]|uniref:Flp family type IVb pilin n=1 Tax=Caballeronia sp. SEWSISQ10-4 2 TaxID=2937438 RepID=UPI0026565E0B|nr:Flp family type IVb pilin [Caballeronia sp. SEWSISQ10-4 2]MDN7178946.1 Flp family type IVb pilin [Caballeronia sp. SEWSISQ10-4 2]